MVKARRLSAARRPARIPSWISDKENQRRWNEQFIGIIKRDYANSDAVISAILNDERLSKLCATKIRSYVDKDVTLSLNAQTKARGVKYIKRLKIAIEGLRAAIELSMDRGNEERALQLGKVADELSQGLGRCKQAFGRKRRGRDRDHSLLYQCQAFLKSELQQSITIRTLANLVNAGYEADGISLKDPVTEEQIRKNLAHFKRNNPLWRNVIDPGFQQRFKEPETK